MTRETGVLLTIPSSHPWRCSTEFITAINKARLQNQAAVGKSGFHCCFSTLLALDIRSENSINLGKAKCRVTSCEHNTRKLLRDALFDKTSQASIRRPSAPIRRPSAPNPKPRGSPKSIKLGCSSFTNVLHKAQETWGSEV